MGSRHYVVDDLGGTVEADPDRLAQVFRNLLSNAVAHTDDGGEITVRATPVGNHVRFEVTDDGPGFGPDEAERLFDRFYRSGTGRARDGAGSGLGLTIARSIVEAHGGSIRAVPSDGAGGAESSSSYLATEPEQSPRPHFRCLAGLRPRENPERTPEQPRMARAGIEPATPRFSVVCSTN